jgi:hypothetical protein
MLQEILLPKFLHEFTGAKSGQKASKVEGGGRTGGDDCNKAERRVRSS